MQKKKKKSDDGILFRIHHVLYSFYILKTNRLDNCKLLPTSRNIDQFSVPGFSRRSEVLSWASHRPHWRSPDMPQGGAASAQPLSREYDTPELARTTLVSQLVVSVSKVLYWSGMPRKLPGEIVRAAFLVVSKWWTRPISTATPCNRMCALHSLLSKIPAFRPSNRSLFVAGGYLQHFKTPVATEASDFIVAGNGKRHILVFSSREDSKTQWKILHCLFLSSSAAGR